MDSSDPCGLVPDRLWSVPIYLPYLQPPLTDAMVEEAESALGVTLPRAYVAALRIQNGGYVRLSAHPSTDGPVDVIAGIGPRFPSLLSPAFTNVEQSDCIDGLLAFCGDGHYFYCFDYRESGTDCEPRITYIDSERLDANRVVAVDFAGFLRQLRPEEQSSAYGLVTSELAEQVASFLSEATGLSFEDQGDDTVGYRVFRARLPGRKLNWAWLSANRTRRGFVRPSDDAYEELNELFPEQVYRYPEHSDCSFFLQCTDFESAAGKAIADRLTDLPFPARPVLLEG